MTDLEAQEMAKKREEEEQKEDLLILQSKGTSGLPKVLSMWVQKKPSFFDCFFFRSSDSTYLYSYIHGK